MGGVVTDFEANLFRFEPLDTDKSVDAYGVFELSVSLGRIGGGCGAEKGARSRGCG